MKVVLYLRYSSDKQSEQSIEGQQRVCTAFCEQQKMTITHVYIDRALSASKHTEKRENFLKMIKDSEKHSFEAVVVYKLDRFSRNRYDSAIYKAKLKKNGVRVISATENISDSPEGIILESVLEGMAEFYSKELAQKVSRGMNETALKANSCGGTIPLGYAIKDGQFVIDPVTAPIAKEAFERYANGDTIEQIANSFNDRGYLTAKKANFNRNSFRRMFRNERYIGIYTYKDIKIEGGIPAIINKEIFEKVQQRMKQNAKAPSRGKAQVEYLLSQKLFCGHCGASMVGESGKSHTGKVYNYYTCITRKRSHSCDKKNIVKDVIEQIVVDDAVTLLTPKKIEEIADIAVKQSELEANQNTVIPALKSEITDTQKSISNLLKLVEKGADADSLFDRLKELETQKKNLEKRLEEEMTDIVILQKSHVLWWLHQFAQGDRNDIKFQRKVIDMLVNSVTIWDDPDGGYKITIVYNLKSDNTKTIRSSDLAFSSPPAGSACIHLSTECSVVPNFIPRWQSSDLSPNAPSTKTAFVSQ